MNMKTRFSLFAALTVFAASLLPANAQKAGIYCLDALTGGTNGIAAASTNNYAANPGNITLDPLATEPYGSPILRCEEFTNVAFTVTLAGTVTNATGTVTFRLARSMDGAQVFEDTPSIVALVNLNGTNAVHTLFNVYAPVETHLELMTGENSTPFNVTGLAMTFNLKAPKFGARSEVQ